jgi:hypothetical protein
MPMWQRILGSVICACFVAGGVLYIAKPSLVRGYILKKGRDSKFVRSDAFLWYLRAVGVAVVFTGLRALFFIWDAVQR